MVLIEVPVQKYVVPMEILAPCTKMKMILMMINTKTDNGRVSSCPTYNRFGRALRLMI